MESKISEDLIKNEISKKLEKLIEINVMLFLTVIG
jgi:hypothetical protein